ncbi:UNVERIFIED_CONTAM: hypothetical protein FKN15_067692 [Acipenser sinensis]
MGACSGIGAQSDCRGRYQLLLSGRALAERYRRIYTAAISDKEQGINQGRGKKALNKKKLKRKQKVKSKAKTRTKVPTILIALQRSVQAVLVGKVQIQDWFGNGIKKAALMNKWVLKEVSIDDDDQCLLQSDGSFLYLLCKDGLFKVGSGYSGTVRGHVYNSTSRIQNRKEKKSWLGYAQGCLLYRDLSSHSMTAVKINPETLEQEGAITMPGLQADAQNIVFTDGEYINQIAACRDDGFVVRIYATSTEPELQQELQLKLARKCLHACGISLFDLEKDLHIMCTGFDEEAAVLGAGREFALMKTVSGKIYYTGKYQSLGIKQGGPSAGKWVELPITKSPKVIQFSVGHDGSHALLVAEDGSVFFTGSASKGEDGESSQVTDLKGHFVTQVAMGKAHTCVLTKDGEVWTFGVNNKGQCGRDTGSMSQAGKAGFGIENMATAMDEDLEEELDEKEEKSMMCQPGMHKWKLDQCMVCTVCGDCTGYGSSCVSSGRPDRVPGGICGCGSGESGCSACGCCKACARELDGQEARQRGIFDAVKEMIPLDVLLAVPVPPGVNIEEHIQIRQEEKRQRINRRHRQEEGRDGSGERGDKDASKITTYPPGAVRFDCALRAVQVSCGFHHSVVLMENGDVYTFGYGQHGQLGQGDVNSRSSPTLVQALPGPSIHVTAGSNHTAVLLMDGQVFTFGSFSKGQLGRPIIDMPYWNAKPSPMPNIGAKYGRKATWIGASGDQTFLRIDEALINSHVLATSEIFASKHIIGLVPASKSEPPPFKCLLINKADGSCRTFNDSEQEDLQGFGVCLDPVYDVIWREKYAMMFDEPVLLQSGWWYVAWARVSGPSSDCGSHGQATITTDDGVVFQFKSSKKSNNGTDVNAGQIPQLLYRLPSNDGNAAKGKQQTSEPVHILKRSFARTVSVECFESLLSILHWSWTTLVLGVEELRGLKGFQYTATLLDLERLRFVGTCCLRLLRVYICEIYPVSASTKSAVDESSKLADCVGKTRSLLRKILSEGVDNCMIKLDNDPEGYLSQPLILLEAVLQECHHTFTACFHSFYPTPALQWACLCDLLNCLDQDIQEANFRTSSSRLLAAVMSALCNTSVKLTSILPIAYDGEVLLRSLVKQVSTENDSALAHRFPLLVAHMEKLSHAEENPMGMTSFREVLEKMLVIVVLPVRKSLRKEVELFSPHLVSNTCGLLASIVSELTASALGSEVDGLNCLHSVKSTPNRFTKTSQGRSWNTGNGSPDAICFTVDRHGVVLVGFCVYGGGGVHEYELEVLADDSVKPCFVLMSRSEYDGDLQSQLVSKANEEDKNCNRSLSVVSVVVQAAKDLLHRAFAVDIEDIPELLSSSSLFSMLLPLILAYIGPVAASVPKAAVEVFGLVQELLPAVSALNQKYAPPAFNPNQSTDSTTGNQPEQGLSACTTSNHYSVTESDHPYKQACVTQYKVSFPDCVRWMTIEFDPQCGTAQPEDVLRLMIPSKPLQVPGFGPKHSTHESLNTWTELKKFSGSCGWPTTVLVLPGNEALFSLETASDYVKDEKASFYGFKCVAVGYEFNPGSDEGIIQLEKELAYLGSVCAAALMKKDLALSIGNELEEDLEILEEASLQVCKAHAGILGKGLALSRSPSILEALEGNLPLHLQSNEHSFLEDFITCVQNSSGGRLARWLQPDSYADPQKTSLLLNKDDIKCGWPTTVTVQTKDQYGDVVHVPNMKVEVKAVPVSQKKSLQQGSIRKLQRIPGSPASAASGADMTFGGLPAPKLEATYEPMIVKEARYIAITMMKVRKFVAKDSAGLRVRSHPSLQSEQIGIVKVNGTITFIEEIHNDDGVWLRLNDETVKKYVPNMNGYTEAWCLSFNQHLGRSLLVPVDVCKAHAGILGKGLALSRSPSILEALEGNLPLHLQSNEHLFLEDFITCVQNSSGGRLARWLQPDSYADPQKTSLLLNKDDIKCGWPTTVTVQTKDQYGDVVHVPNMKVEVKAVPVSQKTSLQQESIRKLQRIPGSPASAASGADMTFGGLPAPKLEATYEPMIVKEARYIAITMMKAYENYSFEELRFASPTPKRPSENMLIRANTDGTYGANWTPGAVGLYTIHVTIDGIEIDAGLEVEVKDPPKGMIPPGAQIVKPKAEPQPSKVRKFVSKDSAGLRVRSHPSLQSEQIGIVKVNGTITFIEEIHNDDGVWLRLNDETVKKYVPNMNGYTEAWCLSFNQHLGRSLLVPVDESRMHCDDYFKEVNARRSHEVSVREQDRLCLHGGPGVYKVTNSEGTWVQLDKNSIVEFCESDEGEAWSLARDRGGNQYLRHEEEQVILDQGAQTPPPSPFSIQAFNRDAAANGAQGYDYGISNNKEQVILDQGAQTPPPSPFSIQAFNRDAAPNGAQGYDYGISHNKGDQLSAILNSVQSRPFLPAPSVFEQAAKSPSSLVHSPFVFGQSLSFQQPQPQPQLPSERGNLATAAMPLSPAGKLDLPGKHKTESRSPKLDGRVSRISADQTKMKNTESMSASESLVLKSDTAKLRSDSHSRSLSPNHNTLQALKADRTSGLRAESPTPGSRSSSPKPKALLSGRSSPSSTSFPRSTSPYEKNLPQIVSSSSKSKLDPPRERSKSDSYTLDPDTLRKKKPPLTEPLRGRSTSPKPKIPPKDGKAGDNDENQAPSPHVVQENLHSEVVEVCTSSTLASSNDDGNDENPDARNIEEGSSKVHFSIGKAPVKEEQETRSSPKVSRKTTGRHVRPKKEKSGPFFKGENARLVEPAKQAMSPSVAECARAVFAAFLWHEGIVHDAMACSSFLKFNPELTKEHAPIRSSLSNQQAMDEKENKLKNRHSLEISSALNMFNISPHGPDISKMGSINKNKVLSMLKEPPLPEKCERGNLATAAMPLSPAGKLDLPGKHKTESRSPKLDGRVSRISADQTKMKNTESMSASESLVLKSDTAKLRSDSHSRSLSPNHNTLQALKADRTSGLRAESPTPGSRSSSPKQKALSSGRSSPSSTSFPRSTSPYEKNLPQIVSSSSKSKLDPPRERSKSDSYTLDPDTLRKKKPPLTEPIRGRSTSPKPKISPKDGKAGDNDENRAPSPHVVQENLHSEVVEVCTSSTLASNNDDVNDENPDAKNIEEGSSKVHFSIGKAPDKEEQETRSSPKVNRKTTGRHVRPKKEKCGPFFKGENGRLVAPAKQAMSPSVAECARAVFAAFLWHEGIVHDAMACSSFLKFNPELTKEHAPIRSSLSSQQAMDEKENKLKNRHSLEISSALNMFNISPHGPDISKMGSINKNKVLSMLKEPPLPEKCEDGKVETVIYETCSQTTTKTKSPLPLTLQHLVAFWEDISMATIKAATQNMIFPSPGSSAILKKKENEKDGKKSKKEKKKKDKADVRPRGNLFGEMAQLAMGGPEKDTICELCGESHPYPVTYHMRQTHPGCGRYAGGQGYNSIGHFCGGWAGNCGDGGIGGSTWYLVCDRCREKYLREKQTAAREKVKQSRKKPMQVKTPRALPTMEAHQVIKANALFLLSLSSAAEPNMLCHHPPKPFHTHLPSLKEGVSEEIPNKIGCLYLQTLARQHSESFGGYHDDNLFQDEVRYLRSTSVPAPYISVTPDASPNVFEEPESNMKCLPHSLETSPITDSDTAKRTVFQRSYSVVASEYDKQNSTSTARVKAIPRRRVNSGDAEVGSSLLRHPSPELSRLISAHGSLSKGERNFQWPVLAFVIQHHDLEGLEVAMRHALRKSACRVFAMEEKDTRVCEHPLSDIVIAGEAAHPLPHTFHRLLQTISDLMMSLPSGSSLQQMALRCWSLKFKQSDHQFLHQSNVFHHINNILSKSDDGDSEESFNISVQSGYEATNQAPSDADLKEHMVGIIFSRSKLTNLQKQVCAHIVQAIRMEATRVREEWEHAISSKENANSQPSDEDASSDAYCFELLSMVLALSGSNVGRQYLAQQLTLLQDLFSLLHTASPRVQRQVTSLLRRVLPEVTPARLASIIGVKALPPADISDIIHSTEKGDWNKLGILDMFLGCIAKALTVQLKAKGTTIAGTAAGKGVTTVTLPMIFNSSYIMRGESHWWMKGSTPPQIAEIIIKLVKDMASGHLSEAWSRVTKNAIAETIIALTKMEEEHRSPVRCIATTRLWLALASLCVLDQDHVDRLSSGRWMGKDGQQKQMVFKEEEEAIKVDLHEGCGRTKLFWLMALADSKTMKAMVEFREHTGKPASSSSEACRFCGTRNGTELSAVGSVCSDADCQEYAKTACSKTHPCGHPCGGVKNEDQCLPCLHGCDKSTSCLKQDADDMCMICFTEALSAAPAVQLDCSHVFHLQCSRRVLDNQWLGPRITFGFMSCPICKKKINHLMLKDLLDPIKELYEDVRRKALMRLEYEGLHKSEAITTPGARFHSDPAGFAMNRYAYYVCYKCKKAYFGGEARCDAEAGQGDDYDPRELICGACSDVSRAQMCSKHGTDFLEYKCRYCCSVAVFFCFGTTHFCNACHDDFQRMTSVSKEELPHCPAGPKAYLCASKKRQLNRTASNKRAGSLAVGVNRMKRSRKGSDGGSSSSSECVGEGFKKVKALEKPSERAFDWGELPQDVVLHIFKYLPLLVRAHASQVCRRCNHAFHMPELWRGFEFELSQPASSYLKAKSSRGIQTTCIQSTEEACDILSQLVNCSLKTLGLISMARPSFMELPKFVNSKSLSSLQINETPVDDPSMKVLVTPSDY